MIHLFCGYDPRETIGFHVFAHTVIERATTPVALIPLSAMGVTQGTNTFTLSRFLIPWIMDFQGHAIFCDASDMLMLEDVSKLDALFDPAYAVQVVKHPRYQTRHKIKYRGTSMECPNLDYPRKNWASVMLVNCSHPAWLGCKPELMQGSPLPFLKFDRFLDYDIGEIPNEWNRMVDEGHQTEGAKMLHWTAGIPAFEQYRSTPASKYWHEAYRAMEELP